MRDPNPDPNRHTTTDPHPESHARLEEVGVVRHAPLAGFAVPLQGVLVLAAAAVPASHGACRRGRGRRDEERSEKLPRTADGGLLANPNSVVLLWLPLTTCAVGAPQNSTQLVKRNTRFFKLVSFWRVEQNKEPKYFLSTFDL